MGEAQRRKLHEQEVAEALEKWKEVNPMMELKIIFVGGINVIGEVTEVEEILKDPRVLRLQDTPQGQMIILQPLVGEPKSFKSKMTLYSYDVKDQKVIDLYIQVTTGLTLAKNLDNVVPIIGKPGRS